MSKDKASVWTELKAKLDAIIGTPKVYKFAKDASTTEGVKIFTEADDWAEGVEVFIEVDGVAAPAPDGTHTLEDGTAIVVKEGKITSITKVEMKSEDDAAAVKEIEAALTKLAKDRNDFAAQLTAKAAEATKLAADHAAAIAAKDAEITTLKAQVTTLSAQVKSVQDGGGVAGNAGKGGDQGVELRADGKPKGWERMGNAERFSWISENSTVKEKTN